MIRVERIEKDHWERYCAPHAHLSVFNERLPAGFDRIDYALVASKNSVEALAYMTLRELDAKTVYLKRGGAFGPLPVHRRLGVYREMLKWLDAYYDEMTTLVDNGNVNYLKFAMAAGFRVIGIRNHEGSILLELQRKKGG